MSQSNQNRKPELIAYTVTGTDDTSFFCRIGGAWANSKGGYNIRLSSLPINGEIVLLPSKEKTNS